MTSSADQPSQSLAGRRVLVTGAAGFLGSHLVKQLLEQRCHVIALVRPASNLWRLQNVLDQVEVIHSDLNHWQLDELKAAASSAGIVYHLAAAGVNQSDTDTVSIVHTNVLGTLHLLQLAQAWQVERFIYCGSCFEYGPGERISEEVAPAPVSEYGASKSAAWMLAHSFARRYDLPVVSLRPFTIYGPFEASYRLIPSTIAKALEGSLIPLTAGEQTRDFIFIDDVVDALLLAATKRGAVGQTLNLCTGQSTSVREVVTMIVGLSGGRAKPLFGALPYRDTELWRLSGDPSRASKHLNWTAQTSLASGLERTIRWFQEQRVLYSSSTTAAMRPM